MRYFLTLTTRKGTRDDICIKTFLSSLTCFSSPILFSGSKPISLHCSDSNVSPCRDHLKMLRGTLGPPGRMLLLPPARAMTEFSQHTWFLAWSSSWVSS